MGNNNIVSNVYARRERWIAWRKVEMGKQCYHLVLWFIISCWSCDLDSKGVFEVHVPSARKGKKLRLKFICYTYQCIKDIENK